MGRICYNRKMEVIQKMKRALVFSGGGSRGAYEIGAWKALDEMGIRFQSVYGASIGAINAALVAQGDVDVAVRLWDNITLSQVVATENAENFSIGSMISSKRDILPFLLENARNLRVDVRPLESMIQESILEGRVRASGLDLNVTTVRVPSMTPVQISIGDMRPGSLTDWLMASSACFPVFPLRTIDGMRYMDGGFYDNLPVDKAIQDGAEEIVCVDIHPDFTHPELERMPSLTVIKPLHALCGFLDFDPKLLRRSRLMGYFDTMKRYGRMDGVRYTFFPASSLRVALPARRYLERIARFDTAAISRMGFLKGQQSVVAPLLSAIEEDLPAGRYDEKTALLRGLELAARIWGFREDALYQPGELTRQIAAMAERDGAFDVSLSERAINEIASKGAPALAGYVYRQFLREGDVPEHAVKALAEHPAETAAALYLLCAKNDIWESIAG
ncbi:MAG: patatin-like phospholipase family protein [Eubacteriales bacterium]|nr:patatin-like phospholipase family protein [Eubacteriales bacterium]